VLEEPGATAFATADATVERITPDTDRTFTVILQTSAGYRLVYGGLIDVRVKPAQKVRRGQTLGSLAPLSPGDTRRGMTYEVWRDGTSVDPFGVSRSTSISATLVVSTTFTPTFEGETGSEQ
jgi:murein DD-endopeptidase MepM/ murein hydrolase activator NlpD